MIEEIVTNNLYEWLDAIRKMPGMYLGGKSLTALYNVIQGYRFAKGTEENLDPDFGDFHAYVTDYYSHGLSTAGWKYIILAECYGFEESAFDNFYKLLDLFRAGYPQFNCKKIIFRLFEKLIFEQGELSLLLNDKEVGDYMKSLPMRLADAQSLFDYDTMFDEIKELADKYQPLSAIITDLAGSDKWINAIED